MNEENQADKKNVFGITELKWAIYIFGLGITLTFYTINYAQSHFAPKTDLEAIRTDLTIIRQDSRDIRESQEEIYRILIEWKNGNR